MKLNAWLLSVLTPLAAISVLAQTPPPPAPPPAVPPPVVSAEPAAAPAPEAPKAKPAKKAKAKAKHTATKAAKETVAKTTNSVIVLNPPASATVKCDVLDVRGQGSFTGEVIGHVKKGDAVTVLEEITFAHAHGNEPKQWSKIVMPTNISVWVSGAFIDPETKAVRVKKVNLRGGPGENYSVVGGLDKGTVVAETSKKAGWLEIPAPTNAYAFVASEYLEAQSAAAPPAVAAAPTPAPPAAPGPPVVVNVAPEPAPAAAAPTAAPAPGISAPAPTAQSQADQELAALRRATAPEPAVAAPTPAPAPVQPAGEENPRVVTREGFVHRSYNIQSPASFELHDIKTGDLTEYLQPTPSQKFKTFIGTRVRITGSEYLDARWPRTPILKVESVDLMP